MILVFSNHWHRLNCVECLNIRFLMSLAILLCTALYVVCLEGCSDILSLFSSSHQHLVMVYADSSHHHLVMVYADFLRHVLFSYYNRPT